MENVDFLWDVDNSKREWRVLVKIIRKWLTNVFPHGIRCHVILSDEKGCKIVATIPSQCFDKIGENFDEGSWKYIHNFSVIKIIDSKRITISEKKMIIDDHTVISNSMKVDDEAFYDFVGIHSILQRQVEDKYCIDVIGCIMYVGTIESCENDRIQRSKIAYDLGKTIWFHIREKSGTYVKCMARGTPAIKFHEMWHATGTYSTIACLRFWTVNNSERTPFLQDSGPVSQIEFDPPIEEVSIMKEWSCFTEANGFDYKP